MSALTLGAAVGVAALLALGGCATSPGNVSESEAPLACDAARMNAIDRAALRRGTELHWVNCPQAPTRAATGAPP